MKTTFILILVLLSTIAAKGQTRDGYLEGDVPDFFNIADREKVDVTGAVAELIIAKDTLYTVVIRNKFYFRNIPRGNGKVTLRHINFESVTQDVKVDKQSFVFISFKSQKVRSLKAAEVYGNAPLITYDGDTIRFNAAAVKLLEGDPALEILKQVPGAEVSEFGIKILGENVARTYVNKQLIFGRGSMTALNNLPAAEVVAIETYLEEELPGSKHKRPNQKVRVLNIKTRNPIVKSVNGHFLASYGHDFERKGRYRYGVGATANFFSERLLLSANVFTNNINRNSNRINDILASKPASSYQTTDYVNVSTEKSWGKNMYTQNTSLSGRYTYQRGMRLNEMVLQNIYFPTDNYQSREYIDTTANRLGSTTHEAAVEFKIDRDGFNASISNNITLKNSNSSQLRRTLSSVDMTTNGSLSDYTSYTEDKLLTGNVYINKIAKVNYFLLLDYTLGKSDGSGMRLDTTSSSPLKRTVESGPIGDVSNVNAKISARIPFSEKTQIDLTYSYANEKSTKKLFTTDITMMTAQHIDSVRSYHYTKNYNTHSAGISVSSGDMNSWTGSVSVRFQSTEANRDDLFNYGQNFGTRQNAFLPQISIRNQSVLKQFSLSYSTSVSMPSIEQWMPYLNDRNPYYLTAGNPSLHQSYLHSVNVRRNIRLKNSSSLDLSANGSLTRNTIVEKTVFYFVETFLPEWNYTVLAQSSLTTYENLNGAINLNASANYSTAQFKAIKGTLTTNLSFSYGITPTYISETLNKTKSFIYGGSVSYASNFSNVLKLTILSKANYIYTTNNITANDRTVNMRVESTINWQNIFKYFFIKANYSFSSYSSLDNHYSPMLSHVLSAVIGCKLMKNNLNLSFVASDVLNRNAGFNSVRMSDYIRNIQTQSFGRYFTFNIGYTLFRSKSGLKKPESLNLKDGSTAKEQSGRIVLD